MENTMPTIAISRNPNFGTFFNVTNRVTQEVEEVESKRKAVRLALKIARRLGENKIIDQDDNWNLIKA